MRQPNGYTLIPLLKLYPIRPDGTVYLSKNATKKLGWRTGDPCQVIVDISNNRLIIENASQSPQAEAKS